MLYRGSRKHILDWVQQPNFAAGFEAMLSPSGARPVAGTWMPSGYDAPDEARLESYGPRHLPKSIKWSALEDWWLVYKPHANTPNWDLIAVCDFGGVRGLALVEAKANVPELKSEGKPLSDDASNHSRANHERIGHAIEEARCGLSKLVPGVAITRDSHYQLANRLAFAWKLASMGLPVVLVYLGFLYDTGITDVGPPFHSDEHWLDIFWQHATSVVSDQLFEARHMVNGTPLWMLLRSRAVISPSPRLPCVVYQRRND